jgi:hypothetical protein
VSRGKRTEETGLSGIRKTDKANIGNKTHFYADATTTPLHSGLSKARASLSGALEMRIALPTATSAKQNKTLPWVNEIGE